MPGAGAIMRDLYQQILDGGEAAIEQLKPDRVQENVELDFKTKERPSEPGLTKGDRQTLGEALSAFSNSAGGLIIWGVIARKNEDDIDCVCGLDPIDHIERFKSEVERAVSQVLMPRHDGVQIEMIKRTSAPRSGYLIIKVERSERRPHRSEAPGAKQYFKRVGDSNIAMEHYDIEDSFKRFVVPALDVKFSLLPAGTRGGSEGDFATVQVTLTLVNRSQVSARYPYLIIDEMSRGLKPMPGSVPSLIGRFIGGANDVIHPDLEMTALEFQREFRVRKAHPAGDAYIAKGALGMTIKFRCACLHSRPTSGTLQITEEEIAQALGITVVA